MKYLKKYEALPKSEEDRRGTFWEDEEFDTLENLGFKSDGWLSPFIFNPELSKIEEIKIKKFRLYDFFYYTVIITKKNKIKNNHFQNGFDNLIDYLKKLIPEDIDAKKYNL